MAKILMLAPEPVLEERGTPFSVYYRCRALSELGHHIDLVTYPIGRDFSFPGLRICRAPRVPFIKRVKIGPSLVKIPLDISLLYKAIICLIKNKYEVIHAHEEAGLFGAWLATVAKKKFVYDMHSSLPQQLKNFEFTNNRLLVQIFSKMEEYVIKKSDAVIVICPDLANTVKEVCPSAKSFLIENMPIAFDVQAQPEKVVQIREELAPNSEKILLYTGTLETYQGIDLLLESIPRVIGESPDVVYAIVGGKDAQIAQYKSKVNEMQMDKHVIFVGQKTPEEMPAYMQAADILLSPRSKGTNTPLKIYSYLRAGKPILATDMLTHTQVLDSDVAYLVSPDADSFAAGTLALLNDERLCERLAAAAKELASQKYSFAQFLEKTAQVYGSIGKFP